MTGVARPEGSAGPVPDGAHPQVPPTPRFSGGHIRSAVGRRRGAVTTDIDSLIRRSGRLEVDDIDFNALPSTTLSTPTCLRCLRYMHDVEGHTVCYLRDVLVTRAHRDPEVTAFLACWSYEEHWHGDAMAEVLGRPRGARRHRAARRSAAAAAEARLVRPWPSIGSAVHHT